MDAKILQTLRIGDTVRIHLKHMSSTDPRGNPFDVVIAGFNGTGRAYKEEDGHYYESRQIKWYWRDMPLELQPWVSVRDDIRGFDVCHEDHIIAIVQRGPYRSQPRPRNVLFAAERDAFLDHQKIEAYRAEKGEERNSFFREKTTPVGYIFSVYNETYGRNIRSSQYNGHVFKLAEALIARRPALVVPGKLDPDRFYAAWKQAERPGYVGPYQHTEYSPSMRNRDGKRIDPSPYKALINRKAFTRWVERNVHRFIMDRATILKNMIQATIDEEEYMRKSTEEETEREYGGRYKLSSQDDEIDDDQPIFYAGADGYQC